MSVTKKKDLITQEEIDQFIKHISNNNDKTNQEQVLKLLQEMQITLDDPTFEDSIDGTRIRAACTIEISRKGGGGAGEERENIIRFQYIKEIHIDYGKVPINIRDDVNNASYRTDVTKDPIIESYDTLEKSIPTLYEILGLLKRIYFMPEDFSNRLAIDRIRKLRNTFSKDEILTLPSIAFDDNIGLIPI
ncbi:MAG TPA: hypothetical protein VE244_04495 [Nitrososphaeraceae archaeon]|jgi:hypothetical protein|nr:hypothetical protein [Nitrososphaeraceae archaeon]